MVNSYGEAYLMFSALEDKEHAIKEMEHIEVALAYGALTLDEYYDVLDAFFDYLEMIERKGVLR